MSDNYVRPALAVWQRYHRDNSQEKSAGIADALKAIGSFVRPAASSAARTGRTIMAPMRSVGNSVLGANTALATSEANAMRGAGRFFPALSPAANSASLMGRTGSNLLESFPHPGVSLARRAEAVGDVNAGIHNTFANIMGIRPTAPSTPQTILGNPGRSLSQQLPLHEPGSFAQQAHNLADQRAGIALPSHIERSLFNNPFLENAVNTHTMADQPNILQRLLRLILGSNYR